MATYTLSLHLYCFVTFHLVMVATLVSTVSPQGHVQNVNLGSTLMLVALHLVLCVLPTLTILKAEPRRVVPV